jgi:hypothetical protein
LRNATIRAEFKALKERGVTPARICRHLAKEHGLAVQQVKNIIYGYGIGVLKGRAEWKEKRRAEAKLDAQVLRLVRARPELLKAYELVL